MSSSQVEPTASTLEVSDKSKKSAAKPWLVSTIGFILVGCLVSLYIFPTQIQHVAEGVPGAFQAFFTEQVLFFMLAGFLAQMIDGALGMAYGVTSSSILLGLGVSPAMASASVHVSEVFTTGISGLSHLKLGNVNRKLFRSLVLPGVIGAVIGAYLLTNIDEKVIKPFVAVYLMIMGVVILRKAFKKQAEAREQKNIAGLALFGGFMDAVGGGGWGPIVASTLLSKGHNPRFTIGSVNLAEFFIATAGAGTFVALIGMGNWHIIAGLVIGGSFAAPFAAYLCKKLSAKTLMIMVGVLIIVLSIRNFYLFLK
ncbi:MAG: sulfite exporter TauE/SafE family protein [Bacteroidota bacterium]